MRSAQPAPALGDWQLLKVPRRVARPGISRGGLAPGAQPAGGGVELRPGPGVAARPGHRDGRCQWQVHWHPSQVTPDYRSAADVT